MISIAIIGSGRLAFQLFRIFSTLNGYEVCLVLGRNEKALEDFKGKYGPNFWDNSIEPLYPFGFGLKYKN